MADISIQKVKTSALKLNKDNPRRISNKDMDLLVKSLQEFPDMMGIREIICDENMVVLGGNMRLLALRKIGAKEVTAKIVSGLTEAQKREFVVKDNGSWGDWDMDALSSAWADLPLVDWGVDLPEDWLNENPESGSDETYTSKIISPVYTPKGERPPVSALIDRQKTEELLAEIEAADLPDEVAQFLRLAAERHTVFNFRQIAEFYCHADAKVQDLMERSALIIIDFKKAIEYGFIHLTEQLGALADQEETDGDA